MARTDAEQITYLEQSNAVLQDQYGAAVHRAMELASQRDKLRTELEIIQGAIGIFGQDPEIARATNCEWMAARIAAALEATSD